MDNTTLYRDDLECKILLSQTPGQLNSKENSHYMYNNGNFPKTYAKIIDNKVIESDKSEATHIIKDSGFEQNENEAFMLWLSSESNIETATTFLIKTIDNKNLLASKRFDIDENNNQLPMYSFNSLLNNKNRNIFSYSFTDLLEKTVKYDLNPEDLLSRTVFSYLTHNYDMHTKNISLLVKDDKLDFSPSYDIVSLSPYYDGANTFAFSINHKNESITFEDIISNASKFMKRDRAKEICNSIKNSVQKNLNMINNTNISLKTIEIIKDSVKKRMFDLDYNHNHTGLFKLINKNKILSSYEEEYNGSKFPYNVSILNINDDQIASELKKFNEEKSDFHDIKTNQNGNATISDKKFHLMTKPYPKGPVEKQTQPLSQMEKFKEFEEIHPPLKTKSLPIRNPLLKSSKAT